MRGKRYPGPHEREADRVYEFCISRGMPRAYCWVLACFASFGEKTWTFQRRIALFTGFCMRRIQRAMRQGKANGVVITTRIRRGSTPENGRGPLTCGGAIKRFIGWGLEAARALPLRLKYAVREAFRREQRRAPAAAVLRESLPPI